METLSFELKEFIEDNIQLIEDKCWDQVYDNASFTLDSDTCGKLTETLLSLGIDPIQEQGFDWIPDYYLSNTGIKEFSIPENIHLIGEGAFSYSKLTSITIPKSVETIRDYVFYECSDLKSVTILGDIRDIGSKVFYNCSEDLVISCERFTSIAEYAKQLNLKLNYI